MPFGRAGIARLQGPTARSAYAVQAVGRPRDARDVCAPQVGADLENVTLYNTGTGSYGVLVAGGLASRRVPSLEGWHDVTYVVAPLKGVAR